MDVAVREYERVRLVEAVVNSEGCVMSCEATVQRDTTEHVEVSGQVVVALKWTSAIFGETRCSKTNFGCTGRRNGTWDMGKWCSNTTKLVNVAADCPDEFDAGPPAHCRPQTMQVLAFNILHVEERRFIGRCCKDTMDEGNRDR